MKQYRTRLLPLLALAAAVLLFAGIYFLNRPDAAPGRKAFTVQITHSDGSVRALSCESAEEYLGTYLLSEGLIEGSQGQFGLYITAVDGESAVYETDGAYWAFYQNGDYATQGVDLTPITEGDAYAFVYTDG